MLVVFWIFVIAVYVIMLMLSGTEEGKKPRMSVVGHIVMTIYTIYYLSIFIRSGDGFVGFLFALQWFVPFILPIFIWWIYLIWLFYLHLKESGLGKGYESISFIMRGKHKISRVMFKHKYITTSVIILIFGGLFIMGISVQQRNSVEAGLESFFNLHPTEDLNELFGVLRHIDPSSTWIIHTSIGTNFERDGREGAGFEIMELWANPNSREVHGEYLWNESYFQPIDPELPPEMIPNVMQVEEDIRRTYPVVLTPDGIRVPDGIEIDNDMRERIENFRLVVQLINLSEESRRSMDIESAAQAQNRVTTGSPSFHIGYNLGDEHPILLNIRQQFDVPSDYVLSRSHLLGNLVFEGGLVNPWHLTPGRNDNTRRFKFRFLSPEEEYRGTTITSFMRVTPNERTPRTEAEFIHERIQDPEINEVETTEISELSLND